MLIYMKNQRQRTRTKHEEAGIHIPAHMMYCKDMSTYSNTTYNMHLSSRAV